MEKDEKDLLTEKIIGLCFKIHRAAKIKTGLQINFGNKSCEIKRLFV